MYRLSQQLFLSFVWIFSLIICVPCGAFKAQAKVVRLKWSTEISSRLVSHAKLRKSFEGRRTPSSIFSSDNDQFPLGSKSDDNWTQSRDKVAEVGALLENTSEVILGSDIRTIDHDASSTASLYKDIYSVRILTISQMHISAEADISMHAILIIPAKMITLNNICRIIFE